MVPAGRSAFPVKKTKQNEYTPRRFEIKRRCEREPTNFKLKAVSNSIKFRNPYTSVILNWQIIPHI